MSLDPRTLEEAAAHVRPAWTRERERAVGERIAEAQRRRRFGGLLFVACTLALAALAVLVVRPTRGQTHAGVTSASALLPAAPLLVTSDGSSVTALSPATRATLEESSDTRTVVRLAEGGAARFEVTPGRPRTFTVLAGDVTVTVLGTVFTVEREGATARVAVSRGRVRVAWPAGSAELAAGESGVFPREDAPVAPPTSPQTIDARPAAAKASASATGSARSGQGVAAEDPAELLRVADEARIAGDGARAVATYRRMLVACPRAPRAPLASFSMGRVLLELLGRPREAALAFAAARSGQLAEDALGREIEAWTRAGDAAKARERAEEYLRLYPTGRRAKSVRKAAGISEP